MRSVLKGFIALVVVVVLAGGGAFLLERGQIDAPGPLPAASNIVVAHGGSAAVANGLARDGVISSALLFRAAALLTSGQGALHAAEFAIPAHASLHEVLDILRHAKPVQHEITIPEGLTAAQIAVLLRGDALLTGTIEPPAEGSVLPQTYAYERGAQRAVLLKRMQAAMDQTLAKTWAGRDAGVGLADAHALLVLASIVERETGVPDERKLVAEVFLNRLRQDMRLQSDPTVAYALTNGVGTAPTLSRADLVHPSPYNTYLVAGLPPTPICSPGLAALEAVAHPAVGQALYFVATGTGGHAFADTLPQHEANVARYRAVMAAKAGVTSGEVVPSEGLLSSDLPGVALPPYQKGVVPVLPPDPHAAVKHHAPASTHPHAAHKGKHHHR